MSGTAKWSPRLSPRLKKARPIWDEWTSSSVVPEHRGLGLGRVVCTEVVRALIEKGYASVVLYTDDWRLPAIGLYLSMGFDPRMDREDMPERWERIRTKLA